MIVGNRKSLEEILEMIKPYRKILLLGCNECVTVCAVGGEREVGVLASELKICSAKEGQEIEIREHTLERQCDHEYIEQIRPFVGDYEVILSMACGAGVQYVAEKYRTKPVLPCHQYELLGSDSRAGGLERALPGMRDVSSRQDGGDLSDCPMCEESAQWSLWRFFEWKMRGGQGDGLWMAVDH